MRTSAEIKELVTALSKAQSEMGPAPKDAVNPHFKSTYADYNSCWSTARGPLTKHGLSLMQGGSKVDGEWICVTRLSHISGQWIETDYPIVVSQGTGPQPFKSATTYARRAGLELIISLASEDDDANDAQSVNQPQKRYSDTPPTRGNPNNPVTAKQLGMMVSVGQRRGFTKEHLSEIMHLLFNIEDSTKMKQGQFQDMLQWIERYKPDDIWLLETPPVKDEYDPGQPMDPYNNQPS